MSASSFLDDLTRLSREEFMAFWKSGAFTGFTEQDMAGASEANRQKMSLFNELLRLQQEAERQRERRRNLGQ